jgi:hypothetical protein
MPPDPAFDPVTARQAAARLDRAAGTIYSWGTRYKARRRKVRGATYFDLADLRVIDREIFHGHPVPATWQDRAAIRDQCPLSAQSAAA